MGSLSFKHMLSVKKLYGTDHIAPSADPKHQTRYYEIWICNRIEVMWPASGVGKGVVLGVRAKGDSRVVWQGSGTSF